MPPIDTITLWLFIVSLFDSWEGILLLTLILIVLLVVINVLLWLGERVWRYFRR